MELSARNVLPRTIAAVAEGVTTAHVKVEKVPGLTVFSASTNEAVDELELKDDDVVSAGIEVVGRDSRQVSCLCAPAAQC
ncbi:MULTISPECIES: transporter [unclassified Bradyrhizobium]|uniref:transporter n=1 Tax=unclassified Bradyrhizobium TaxID=2631580 RepID=UPI0028E547DA|nr:MULTISPECIES: transporter [unclassified Bradyrhizobium]